MDAGGRKGALLRASKSPGFATRASRRYRYRRRSSYNHSSRARIRQTRTWSILPAISGSGRRWSLPWSTPSKRVYGRGRRSHRREERAGQRTTWNERGLARLRLFGGPSLPSSSSLLSLPPLSPPSSHCTTFSTPAPSARRLPSLFSIFITPTLPPPFLHPPATPYLPVDL